MSYLASQLGVGYPPDEGQKESELFWPEDPSGSFPERGRGIRRAKGAEAVTNEVATTTAMSADILEKVVAVGDLSVLSPAQRTQYYQSVCQSLGLNPLTRPFEYIKLNGRLTLYTRRDATDQLRRIHGISVVITSREMVHDLYIVTARATDASGRSDESIGAVSIANLSGDALANALMRAETKAKRRVTLSICGLGWTDETEVETIPGAQVVEVAEQALAPEVTQPPAEGAHWSDPEEVRIRFWDWVETEGLASDQVYEALGGIENLREFRGSKGDAMRAINAYIEAHIK